MGEEGVKFACHTPCFRSEAGSYGRDTRGMIRQHQFEKVELVQMVRPVHSSQALEQLTGHAEAVLRALNLPYRKVILCGGDIGFSPKRPTTWKCGCPPRDTYREISPCSNFGDYQARRMQARCVIPKPESPNCCTLSTARAWPWAGPWVAILENYRMKTVASVFPGHCKPTWVV